MNAVFSAIKNVLPQRFIDGIRWIRRKKRKTGRRISSVLHFFRHGLGPWIFFRGKKNLGDQIVEIRYLWKTFGGFPAEYFIYRHYRKGVDGKKLIPRDEFWLTRRDFNHPDRSSLQDKSIYRKIAEQAGVPIVKELFCVWGGDQIVGADGTAVSKENALGAISTLGGKVFIKPVDSQQGEGAYSCNENTDFSFLFEGRNWIVQPIIQQHRILSDLYPNSINTLRIDTFAEDGVVQVCNAFLRMGMGGAVVDNASQGGLTAPVDAATGRVIGPGRQMTGFDPQQKIYSVHPDTGVTIEDIQLPDIAAAHKHIICAAQAMPQYGSVGWDVAFTTDGPIVVEGNYFWEINIVQSYFPLGFHPLGKATYKRLGIKL